MSALLNGFKLARRLYCANPILLRQATRNLALWNKDFKPGEYPKTKEEREEAAKKYNLLPEEYRPYANNGLGHGDYPVVGYGLGTEAKDCYYPYDFPELKRNLHEPISADVDLYSEDRYSQPQRLRYPMWYYYTSFLTVMVAVFVLFFWLEKMKLYRPVAEKQYPGDGKKHYTFEH